MAVDLSKLVSLERLKEEQGVEHGMIATVESSSTASKAYAIDDRFYFRGKLCLCTSPIASGGTITLNTNCRLDVLGDDVSGLKNAITKYNSYDILQNCRRVSGTASDVTWTWNEDGSCTVSGTASSLSTRLLAGGESLIADGIIAGATYHVKYNSTNVALQLVPYLNDTALEDVKLYSDSIYTVPSNITGFRIRILVARNATANETVNPVILNAMSNEELESYAKTACTEVTSTAIIDSSSQWSFNGIISRSGYDSESGTTTFACSDFISVTEGDYIRLIKCTSTTDYYLCIFYDNAYNYVNGCKVELRNSTYNTYDAIVPTGASYMRVQIRQANASLAKVYKITERIVEEPDSVGIKVVENFVSDTGNLNKAPFVNLKSSHAPLFALIDDDTRSVNQVKDFYKICDDNEIYGTSACITQYPFNDADIKTALLQSELKGHQTVFHCHNQFANSHWSDPVTYRDDILEDIATGIHEISGMGFCDWRHWVTPAGVTNDLIQSLARKYGFSSITSITQNDYLGYDGYWSRWNIPRMELYPTDEGQTSQTLANIKAKADACVARNGWLLVGIHTWQDSDASSSYSGTNGWNNTDGESNQHAVDVTDATTQARFEARFARIYELIEYVKGKGMNCVTLGESLSYWEPVFRMYESF